jgi:glycosyltransferase involved in cell wall biosynthesis
MDMSASSDVSLLLQTRRYRAALDLLDSAAAPDSPDWLRTRRRCLACLEEFAAAADCGRALVALGAADPEDLFRQAQLEQRAGRPAEALEAALAAATAAPDDPRLAPVLAEPVLSDPRLLDRLAAAFPSQEPAARVGVPTTGRIFVPLRLPYYAPFDADHPGTMGMIERAAGLDFHIARPEDGGTPADLPDAVRRALPLVEALTRVHPCVDRAAAARFVAVRISCLTAQDGGAQLDFLSNLPMTLGQRPWVLWFDIPGVLFQPFQRFEAAYADAASPWYWLIRHFLESDACLSIITHYPLAGHPLTRLFASPKIDGKLVFINPYDGGGDAARAAAATRRRSHPTGRVRLLFTSSHVSRPDGFFHRGGVDVLAAFLDLAAEFDDIELTMRAAPPPALGEDLRRRALAHPRIRWISRRLDDDAFAGLMAQTDIFLLPSVVLFRNGLIQAMKAGAVPVVSDMPGAAALVDDGENGLIVSGRGRLTTISRSPPILRHDWDEVLQAEDAPSDPVFFASFKAALRRLLTDRELLARLSRRNMAADPETWGGAADLARFADVMRDAASKAATITSA